MHAKRIFRDINLLAAPSPTEVTRKSEYTPPPLNTAFASNRGVGVYSEFVRNFRAYAHVPLLYAVYNRKHAVNRAGMCVYDSIRCIT